MTILEMRSTTENEIAFVYEYVEIFCKAKVVAFEKDEPLSRRIERFTWRITIELPCDHDIVNLKPFTDMFNLDSIDLDKRHIVAHQYDFQFWVSARHFGFPIPSIRKLRKELSHQPDKEVYP